MNGNKEPLVSVVTITYNHELFIEKAINGVLLQDFDFEVEYIIANDASSDNSHQVILDALSKAKEKSNIKFRYYNHTENKGMSPNFIWSLKEARGKYIALCEGDDYWTDPLKLQKQVDFLEANPDYVLTSHAWRNKFIDGKLGPISTTSMLLTLMFRNVLDEFPEEFYKAPNGDTFLRFMLKMKGKFNFIEGVDPGIRRIHEGCLMGKLSEIDKLPRRIETNKQIYLFANNTEYAKETKERYMFFKLKFIQMKTPNLLLRVWKTVLFIFKHGHLKLAITGLIKN